MPAKFSSKPSCQQKRPAKVCFEDAIPNVRRQCVQFAKRDANVPSCIVGENVDPPKMVDHISRALINRMGVPLVKLHGMAAPASLPQRLHDPAGTSRFSYVGNRNIRSGSGESLRDRWSRYRQILR